MYPYSLIFFWYFYKVVVGGGERIEIFKAKDDEWSLRNGNCTGFKHVFLRLMFTVIYMYTCKFHYIDHHKLIDLKNASQYR